MSITSDFDPARDGWSFPNWRETDHYIGSPELSWDLFRQAYLGVNPTHDCLEAPLDCTYYEVFKNCAGPGNCGGMSLLGLAVYKYGGYAGFCGPANFYTGLHAPDRQDLHQAINVFHGRQFSAPFVENFLDLVNSGDLGNAEAAYKKIEAQRGSGDYALLSIATDKVGGKAHTIIPYEVDPHPGGEPAGTKYIYVWDSQFPYSLHKEYYTSRQNRLVVHGAFDWEYRQGFYNGEVHDGTLYKGTPGSPGWCIATPMSLILHKAPHPISAGFAIKGLVKVLVTGTGCAVSQIEDGGGRRFYTSDTDGHLLNSEIETDPSRRLTDACRWPWFDQGPGGEPPGELYFLRRRPGGSELRIAVHGTDYDVSYTQGTDLVEVSARGAAQRSRDVLTLNGVGTDTSLLRLAAEDESRRFDVTHRRIRPGAGWRGIEVRDARVGGDALVIRSIADMQAFEVAGEQRRATCRAELKRYAAGALTTRALGEQAVEAGERVRVTPRDWSALEHADVLTEKVRFGRREAPG